MIKFVMKGNEMKNCIFCKIVDKKIKSNVLYEDDTFLVFLDNSPIEAGHMLIVPKKHVVDYSDIDDETFKKMNQIIKNMINLLKEKLKIDGVKICQNNGICQEVKHYHFHIIPKYNNKINLNIEDIYKKLMEK